MSEVAAIVLFGIAMFALGFALGRYPLESEDDSAFRRPVESLFAASEALKRTRKDDADDE